MKSYVYRYSADMPRKKSGGSQMHKSGSSPEIVDAHRFSTAPPKEKEGDYTNQVGNGEQGEGEINAGGGNPKATGEAARR